MASVLKCSLYVWNPSNAIFQEQECGDGRCGLWTRCTGGCNCPWTVPPLIPTNPCSLTHMISLTHNCMYVYIYMHTHRQTRTHLLVVCPCRLSEPWCELIFTKFGKVLFYPPVKPTLYKALPCFTHLTLRACRKRYLVNRLDLA